MSHVSARAVPLLPCQSIDDAADVGEALGFEVSYRQSRPQPYVALRSEHGIELHYFVVPDLDPARSYGACLIAVSDPAAVLQRWTAGLIDHFGAVPTSGYPRLIAPRGATDAADESLVGFSLVDTAGNRIRVVREVQPADEAERPPVEAPDESLPAPDPSSAVVDLPPPPGMNS